MISRRGREELMQNIVRFKRQICQQSGSEVSMRLFFLSVCLYQASGFCAMEVYYVGDVALWLILDRNCVTEWHQRIK